jgi:hypothetical protein
VTDEIIEIHGHKSASQRREYALQVEAMRMKILADHLRAIVILLLRRLPENQNLSASFTKEEIASSLGQKLDSLETEDKASVVFTCTATNEFLEPQETDCPDPNQK